METIRNLSDAEISSTVTTLGTGTTVAATAAGSSITSTGLQPIEYLKKIVEAAKNQHFFKNFVSEYSLPKGTYQMSIPKRKLYLGRSGVTYGTTEPTTSDITVTQIDNMDNVTALPTISNSGVALSNYGIRVNLLNLLQWAKEELSYAIGDRVDYAIATAIGDATLTTSTVGGAQTLYGGDATGDSGLAATDKITTDLVAKSMRYLKTVEAKYWSSGTETASAGAKNPWNPTSTEPFVYFIAPMQEETFLTDSQFVNAAEYGNNKVIMNGEIGEYLGVKIIVTNNVESVNGTGSVAGPDGSNVANGVNMTRCIMMKAKVAAAIVWGQKPTLKVFDRPERDQTWITLLSAYVAVVTQPDAIVFTDVAY